MAIRSAVTPEVPVLSMTETEKNKPTMSFVPHSQHHIIMRTVVPPLQANAAAGRMTADEIDQYINSFLREGWSLVNTHFIEKVGDQAFTYAWILIR